MNNPTNREYIIFVKLVYPNIKIKNDYGVPYTISDLRAYIKNGQRTNKILGGAISYNIPILIKVNVVQTKI